MTGTINLLGGGPYSGKTTLLRTMLRACHDGTDFFGLATKSLPSWCHVVSDRDQEVFLSDCAAMGLPAPVVSHLWCSVADKQAHGLKFQLRQHAYGREWLGKQLKTWAGSGQLQPGGLVTVDTIMPFVPDARSYADSWLAAQQLRDLAAQYKCVLLGIAHAGKYKHMQSAATPWERIQLSMALIGCTDTTLYVCSAIETQQTKFGNATPEGESQLITLKGRRADSHYWLGKIEIAEGTTYFTKVDELGQENKDQKGGDRGGRRPFKVSNETIKALVADGASTTSLLIKTIIATCGVVEMTARTAINRAVNTGVVLKALDGGLALPQETEEQA